MEGTYVDLKKFEAYKKQARDDLRNEMRDVNGRLKQIDEMLLAFRQENEDNKIRLQENIDKCVTKVQLNKRLEDFIRFSEFHMYKHETRETLDKLDRLLTDQKNEMSDVFCTPEHAEELCKQLEHRIDQ
jgi:hypothetical protein